MIKPVFIGSSSYIFSPVWLHPTSSLDAFVTTRLYPSVKVSTPITGDLREVKVNCSS